MDMVKMECPACGARTRGPAKSFINEIACPKCGKTSHFRRAASAPAPTSPRKKLPLVVAAVVAVFTSIAAYSAIGSRPENNAPAPESIAEDQPGVTQSEKPPFIDGKLCVSNNYLCWKVLTEKPVTATNAEAFLNYLMAKSGHNDKQMLDGKLARDFRAGTGYMCMGLRVAFYLDKKIFEIDGEDESDPTARCCYSYEAIYYKFIEKKTSFQHDNFPLTMEDRIKSMRPWFSQNASKFYQAENGDFIAMIDGFDSTYDALPFALGIIGADSDDITCGVLLNTMPEMKQLRLIIKTKNHISKDVYFHRDSLYEIMALGKRYHDRYKSYYKRLSSLDDDRQAGKLTKREYESLAQTIKDAELQFMKDLWKECTDINKGMSSR
ncbi:MAG: hypothetical protein JXR97_12350 [Planctomycetes bacterium]|nr:hypothetical protein [Planctomycetota bacterium]